MTDIFASDRQSQQARFNAFFEGVQKVISPESPWVIYYCHPTHSGTTRLEIRQDLLNDWSASRYTALRLTRKSHIELVECCKLVFKWALALEEQGMFKTLESLGEPQQQLEAQSPRESLETLRLANVQPPAWVKGLIAAFTLHNDWIDLATCLSLSADEYVDANWRRFYDWLCSVRKNQPTDLEVYAFGVAVWQAYRQDVIV